MTTKDQLEAALREMPGVESVTVEGERNLVATVVSSSFTGQGEAERQEAVWGHLQERIDWPGLRNVEFVFTNAPGELV